MEMKERKTFAFFGTLHGNKLSEESLKESISKKEEHFGFIPKIESTIFNSFNDIVSNLKMQLEEKYKQSVNELQKQQIQIFNDIKVYFDSKFDSIQSNNDKITKEIKDTKNIVTNLSEKIQSIENNIQQMSNKNDDLQNKVQNIMNQINVLKNNQNQVLLKCDNNHNDAQQILGKINDIKNNIDQMSNSNNEIKIKYKI